MVKARTFLDFAKDEDGAVTVDWVVLTAAVIALVLLVFTVITRDNLFVGAQVIMDTMSAANESVTLGPAEGTE